MSDREDPEEKITVLFSGDDGESSQPEKQDDDEMSQPEQGDSEPDQEDDAGSSTPEDNVVHLDFDNKSVDESPSPESSDPLEAVDAEDVEEAKYEVFRRMIDEGMVMVTLDTRVDGVEVPPKFSGLPELRLNFSHLFHIDDFDYDDQGVRASLSFDGTRYFCDVPWNAVYMLYSHESGDVVVFESSSTDRS